jgi:predicted MFS family arabinose efflux permease
MGLIGSTSLIQIYKLQVVTGILTAINVFVFTLADSFWWMVIHVVMYGLIGSALPSLFAVAMADFVGLERLPRGIGLVLGAMGLATSIAPPILGRYTYIVTANMFGVRYASSRL